MKKPVIGIIPTYNLENKQNDPYEDRASFVRMYVEKIRECGGIPIGLLDTDAFLYMDVCDAYVWPGGNRILRDFYPILEDARRNKKPVLGVCLGSQAIATYFNILEDKEKFPDKTLEEIYQQEKEQNPYLKVLEDKRLHSHYVTKDQETIEKAKHKIQIKPNTFLYDIYKTDTLNVVSLHSVIINRNSKDTIISSKAEDNVIESIEYHKDGNHFLGVQFHPEILEENKIFTWLIEKAIEYKEEKEITLHRNKIKK